ncbi:MAG: PQQ-binding-like beta-propeller repeat protein [Verrucomicrobiales bacterium]
MRNTFILFAIGIFLICPAVAEDERIWTSSSGSRIEAALVSTEVDKVVLKTADGRVINVRMDQLSKADREYLAGLTKLSPDLAPVQQWSFDAGSVEGSELVAARGGLGGEILGDSRLVEEGSLSYMELVPAAKVEGTSVAGGILLATDPIKAGLPVAAMTVEAWVQLDSILEWGGIIGAVRDTGDQEMGWVLGYRGNRFCFGLATEEVRRITYLNAASTLVTKAWYHLVATYDGTGNQRLYVDGKPSAHSETQRGAVLQPDQLFYTIGAYRDENDYHPFSGRLAGISVWHRELNPEEIAARFAARKDQFPGMEPPAPVRPGNDEEWATWMSDNLRSGRAPGSVQLHSSGRPLWVYYPAKRPAPAWPETAQSDHWRRRAGPETPKVTFDWVHDVVVSGGRLFFGSSADDGVRCLDAETGRLLWTFSAGGPVRLAPTVSNGRVFFGCDDGALYCLEATDGTLRWKARPSSVPDRRLPGNGRIMSVWPVRTGVLVNGATGYFGAGLFPGEGAYYCSVDLRDGRIIDEKPVNFSPQGYIFENGGELFAQAGRTSTNGVFSRVANGRKNYAALESRISKAVRAKFPYALVETPELVLAGGKESVAAFKPGSEDPAWQAQVDGPARGLAVAGGRLFVSTTMGTIYAFGAKTGLQTHRESKMVKPGNGIDDLSNGSVGRLIKQLPRQRGYALVVGVGNGSLIRALAERTQLHVVGIDTDGQRIARLRQEFFALGLYGAWESEEGKRGSVALQEVANFGELPFVDGIFNLVTNGTADVRVPPDELQRLLRPWDGIAVFGDTTLKGEVPEGSGSWTHAYGDTGNSASSGDLRVDGKMRLRWFGRPGPEHIVDRHLRAPPPLAAGGYLFVPGRDFLFGLDAHNGTVLWKREVPAFMRASMLRDCGNLAIGTQFKRVFAASGPDCLVINAATGATERKLSVKSADEEWGYLAIADDMLVGSAVDKGAVRRELSYTAIWEGGYGDNKRVVCSRRLFTVDLKSGRELWNYRPRGAIANPSICIKEGTLFFLESGNEDTIRGAASRSKDSPGSSQAGRWGYDELVGKQGASLVALDLGNGKELWRRPLELPLSGIQTFYLSASAGSLVAVHSVNTVTVPPPPADGKSPQQGNEQPVPAKKPTLHYAVEVMDAGNGKTTWEHGFDTGRRTNLTHGEQDLHPVIAGGRLIVEPKVFNLADGKILFSFARLGGGGCGAISASSNKLYYRAGNPAEFNLDSKKQEWITKSTRPGCWINMIPANGLLLVPEGSSGCICSFPVQASMAYGTEAASPVRAPDSDAE